MSFDVPTLTFAGGFVALSSSLLVLLYWWHDRTAWAACWWAIASFGAGVGTILLALHGVVPSAASDILGPWLLDVCAALTWVASRIFNRGTIKPYPVLAGVSAWIAMLAITGVYDSEQVAAAIGAIIAGALYVASAVEFWLTRTNEELRGRWPMISVLSLFSISLFLAAVGFLLSTNYIAVPSIGWLGSIHFVAIVYSMGGALSLVVMLKERSEAKYKTAALIDPLTGLANRRAFMERAQHLFDRSGHEGTPISLLALDLDRFKVINDTFGHPTGDQVMQILADGLSRALRPADTAARMGGEEFAVVLPGCSSPAALAIAGRIQSVFESEARFVNGQRIGATVSVGVATALGPACSLADTLASADGALYRAKNLGRNRVLLAVVSDGAGEANAANVIKVA
jgi:diguanylate cyclase (GGDEF)-like protein